MNGHLVDIIVTDPSTTIACSIVIWRPFSARSYPSYFLTEAEWAYDESRCVVVTKKWRVEAIS